MMGFWDVHRPGEASEGVAEMMIRERGKKATRRGESGDPSHLLRPSSARRKMVEAVLEDLYPAPTHASGRLLLLIPGLARCPRADDESEFALARALGSGRVGRCHARPDVRTSFPAYCLALC